MQLLKTASLLALAGLARATTYTIEFQSLDDKDRTMVFTASVGHETIPNLSVPGGKNVSQTFKGAWNGNIYGIKTGAPEIPGMLAEVAFGSWDSITFFDVSAIVNPNDVNDVSELFPKISQSPVSGCGALTGTTFPCDNAYYVSDALQTKATTETTLVCTLATNGASKLVRDIPEQFDERGDFPDVSREFAFAKRI